MNENMGMRLKEIKSGVVKRVKNSENTSIETEKPEDVDKRIEGKLKSDIAEFQKDSSVYFPYAEGKEGQKEATDMLEKLRKDLGEKANN